MLPLNLDPVLVVVGVLFVMLLSSVRPAAPPPPIVVVQTPQPEAPAGGILLGLFIFGLLVTLLVLSSS